MAAIVGLLMAKLNAGDEVIFFDECYHRSREFCTKHLSRFGVVTRQVKACDYEAMEAAITPKTQLLVSESPTNPHLSVVDLERFVDLGQQHSVETLIDATLATPYNLRPIAAGVDYVLHSATKYLAGHNDLLAGVIVGRQRQAGAGPQAPRHHGGHQLAAQYLPARARAEDVRAADAAAQRERPGRGASSWPAIRRSKRSTTPACEAHPYHEVARRTMRGFGGLVTFLVKDADWRQTAAVVDAVQDSADRAQPGRRRIADRAAAGDELLRMHAGRPQAVRHLRQHDPPVLRHREHRRPDRRSAAGPGPEPD